MEALKMEEFNAELSSDVAQTGRNRSRTVKPLCVLAVLSVAALLWQSSCNGLSLSRDIHPTENMTPHRSSNLLLQIPQGSSPNNASHELEPMLHGVVPRPFPKWSPGTSLPCEPLESEWNTGHVQHRKTKTGLLFVKPPKTGSTTAASVTLRIASRLAQKTNASSSPLCKNRVQHAAAHEMGYDRRDKTKSVLWSILREPTSRTVSQFFHFHVSRRGKNTTDEVFRQFLEDRRHLLTDFQLKYLSFKDFDESTDPIAEMNRVLHNYDFIGVSERMDESLVALQMILGLETADVVHISAKGSGSYDDGRYQGRCVYIQKSFVSPGMEAYFNSEDWKRVTRYDSLFHQAVNRSLDLTIEALGREAFHDNLARYRAMQSRIASHCLPRVRMPCDDHGSLRRHTSCLYDDMGCGFECLDRVAAAVSR